MGARSGRAVGLKVVVRDRVGIRIKIRFRIWGRIPLNQILTNQISADFY